MKLSILTATFNRGDLLQRLYESIIKNLKTNIDVEWLIMDDGSNDDTEKIISNMRDENKIYIRYLKQVNQGKMAAINHLMDYVRGDLIIEWDVYKRQIETFANRNSKTATGKLVYKFADLFIVQWEEMLKLYPKAKLGGAIYWFWYY